VLWVLGVAWYFVRVELPEVRRGEALRDQQRSRSTVPPLPASAPEGR
jgi:hypothetical protein